MSGVPSKARLIADRARLARMLRDDQSKQFAHLSNGERLQLVANVRERIQRLDREIASFETTE